MKTASSVLPRAAFFAALLAAPLPATLPAALPIQLPTLLCLGASAALASPNHAHWHYQIGGRASAARNFCKQLHHEASAPGDFSWELARVNAVDIERLAVEIGTWLEALEKVSSEEERRAIEPQLAAMAAETRLLIESSGNLVGSFSDDGGDASSRQSDLAFQARTLFHGFGRVLAAHKAAEEALGIPAPSDPPPLE
jgi:hypothetical protein